MFFCGTTPSCSGVYNELIASADGGRHFTVIKSTGYQITGFAAQGDTIYAATWGGLLISRNGGSSFDMVTDGLANENGYIGLTSVYAEGSSV